METVVGHVENIIYQNRENGYTVLELMVEDDSQTLTGFLPHVSPGDMIRAVGKTVIHSTYGPQFSVESYETVQPEGVEAIERYLGSGAIKGLGTAMAERIVRRFGEDTMRIIDEEPERLAEVKGISEKGARNIAIQVAEKKEGRQVMMYLQTFGLSPTIAAKIQKEYGMGIFSLLQKNPYQLADDIPGITFPLVDAIAAQIGFVADDDFRKRSAMHYILSQALGEGHIYLPKEELFARTCRLLQMETQNMDKQLMDRELDHQLDQRFFVTEKEGIPIVYLYTYYSMEMETARKLVRLNGKYHRQEKKLEAFLERAEKRSGICLDIRQKEAVEMATYHGVSIITGGPGTGKTTTINTILQYFAEEKREIVLAAPTGRASKRMEEATGHEAKTIHRLLEFSGAPTENDEELHFERNASHPLDADVVIIDEMSMVDLGLMSHLLEAIPVGCRLVLVGDANQLPSVGPGNVLRDILHSGVLPVVELTHIFRQEKGSGIVENAHRILAGEDLMTQEPTPEFSLIQRFDTEQILEKTVGIVKKNYHRGEVQVLTPMRKGPLGVENLNVILQQAINPPKPNCAQKEFPSGILREGDKVMQIRNNYQAEWKRKNHRGEELEKGSGVFNGDLGIIRQINAFSEEIEVEFDEGHCITYSFSEAVELELAYAITIHKSQGSEYPAVILPVLGGPSMLMNRNLLYTAVTRARQCVRLIGPASSFQRMVDNIQERKRYSSLDDRIREVTECGKPEDC